MTEKISIGRRIQYFRIRYGMTREQLARRIHTSPRAILQWEKEERQPRVQSVINLAEAFGISIDKLIGRTTTKTLIEEEGKTYGQKYS